MTGQPTHHQRPCTTTNNILHALQAGSHNWHLVLVSFPVLIQIKPQAPPLVCPSVNSFKFQPCGRSSPRAHELCFQSSPREHVEVSASFTVGTTRVSNPVRYSYSRPWSTETLLSVAFASAPLQWVNAFHRSPLNSTDPDGSHWAFRRKFQILRRVIPLDVPWASWFIRSLHYSDYGRFNCNNMGANSQSWNYRSCWHQTGPLLAAGIW